MQIVLLISGVLSGVAGLIMLGYGAANHSAPIGHTLLISGTNALAAGLIVVGLAAVVSRIRRLAEALDRQPLPRIAGERFDIGRYTPNNGPEPRPVHTPPASTVPGRASDIAEEPQTASETLPDTHQGIDADVTPHPIESLTKAATIETEKEGVNRGGEPRDHWRAAISGETGAAEPMKTTEPTTPTAIEARPQRYQPSVPQRSASPPRPLVAESSASLAQPIILKSGVLDGMAYTLYSDGSIEAELRDGTKRFRSIPELRAYMFEQAK